MSKRCLICNIEIDTTYPKGGRKFCPECSHKRALERCHDYNLHRSERTGKFCKDCDKPLAWKNKTGYCHKCLLTNHRYGENCPSWKGGIKKDKDGYIFIYHPEPHPRRLMISKNKEGQRPTYYVAEHVLNWEKANGIPLPNGFTVHHLNGIKSDNRPKNLIALPSTRHSSGMVNEALQKRIRELEGIIAQTRFSA